jgi:putative inorganic carbon (HCO3(-)) transporter
MGFALLIVYIVFTFVRPGELVPALADWRIMEVVSILAILGAGLGLLTGRGPTFRAPQIPLLVAFFAWAAVSLLATGSASGTAFERLTDFAKSSGVAFLLVVLNVDSIRRVKIVAATFALMALFEAGQGVLAYHSGIGADRFLIGTPLSHDPSAMREAPEGEGSPGISPHDEVPRIRGLGFLADPNDLANVLVAFLPLILAFRKASAPGRNLVFVWPLIAASLYCVYLTRSRGGILALAAVVALGFRARLGRFGAGLVAALAVVVLLWLGFAGGRSMTIDESAEGRIDAWSEGLQMLKGSPLWGVGFSTFDLHYERAAHSAFVQCFAELGLVGYFLWLAVLAVTLDDVRTAGRWDDDEEGASQGDEARELARWGRALTVSLVGFLVGALFLSHAYDVMLYLILGLAVAFRDVACRLGHAPPARHLVVWVLGILLLEGTSIVALWGYMRILR